MGDVFNAAIHVTLGLDGASVTTLGSCVVFGVVIVVVLTTVDSCVVFVVLCLCFVLVL